MTRKAKPLSPDVPWTCYAKPVRLRGRLCLHVNTEIKARPMGHRQRMVVFCDGCGCFRNDEDARRDRARKMGYRAVRITVREEVK